MTIEGQTSTLEGPELSAWLGPVAPRPFQPGAQMRRTSAARQFLRRFGCFPLVSNRF